MVDGGGLLSRCRGFSLTLGSNPSLSVAASLKRGYDGHTPLIRAKAGYR